MTERKLTVMGVWNQIEIAKGVKYSEKTDTRYHYIEDLGVYVGSCFSLGNVKIGDNVAVTKLKEIFTCLDCKDCKKDCYAKDASDLRPTVNNYRWFMTYMAINHLETYKAWLIEDLKKIAHKIKYVRIHESGDFFSQAYVNMWVDIIKMFPEIDKFYFYTKSEPFLDFSVLLSLPNVNRVKSRLPNGDVNFDDEPIIKEKCESMGVPLCPYGVNGNWEAVHCGTQCTKCMHSECVGFVKHGRNA